MSRGIQLPSMALALAFVLTGAHGSGAVIGDQVDGNSVSATNQGDDGCGWCRTCVGGHNMNASGGKQWHDCINIPCMEHPDCGHAGLQKRDLQRVWLAARGADALAAKRTFEQFAEYLVFNAERHAIQVESCGQLIAHIPLARSLATVAEAALE